MNTVIHEESMQNSPRLGNTAVVTAKLWKKGTNEGKPFDYTLWLAVARAPSPQRPDIYAN